MVIVLINTTEIHRIQINTATSREIFNYIPYKVESYHSIVLQDHIIHF